MAVADPQETRTGDAPVEAGVVRSAARRMCPSIGAVVANPRSPRAELASAGLAV